MWRLVKKQKYSKIISTAVEYTRGTCTSENRQRLDGGDGKRQGLMEAMGCCRGVGPKRRVIRRRDGEECVWAPYTGHHNNNRTTDGGFSRIRKRAEDDENNNNRERDTREKGEKR